MPIWPNCTLSPRSAQSGDELDHLIVAYESAFAAAKRDFVNIDATLALFEQEISPSAYPSHTSIARMFERGEIFELCKIALSDAPQGLDTRNLASHVIPAKSLNEIDDVLRRAIGYRIVRVMLRQAKRGMVFAVGKRGGVRIWSVDR
jgi:hypothetical protein